MPSRVDLFSWHIGEFVSIKLALSIVKRIILKVICDFWFLEMMLCNSESWIIYHPYCRIYDVWLKSMNIYAWSICYMTSAFICFAHFTCDFFFLISWFLTSFWLFLAPFPIFYIICVSFFADLMWMIFYQISKIVDTILFGSRWRDAWVIFRQRNCPHESGQYNARRYLVIESRIFFKNPVFKNPVRTGFQMPIA